MKSYRDLIVWQKSMNLVTLVYSLTSEFPENEKFGLTSQIKRSTISIPSNISESYGRNYRKDYSRFFKWLEVLYLNVKLKLRLQLI
jgi:four helix bundle protein